MRISCLIIADEMAVPEGVAEVCGWLTHPRTREQLESIYFESDSEKFAPTLAQVIERLEVINRA